MFVLGGITHLLTIDPNFRPGTSKWGAGAPVFFLRPEDKDGRAFGGKRLQLVSSEENELAVCIPDLFVLFSFDIYLIFENVICFRFICLIFDVFFVWFVFFDVFSDLKLENKTSLAIFFGNTISCLGSTWMSQEVSKRLGSGL